MAIASVEGWFLEVEGRRIDLRTGEVTIGRSRGCGVVLRDPSVSRGHALLSVQADHVTLQDLRSSNGSYVNGTRIDAETPLAAGDRVVIGETALYLRRAQAGAAQVPVPSDGAAFCPACGSPVDGDATACPCCGAALGGARLPRRSEAPGLGEVLPVGEVLGSGSASWEQTTFRQGSAAVAPLPNPASPAAPPSHSTSSTPSSAAPSPPTRASAPSPPTQASAPSAAAAASSVPAADPPTEVPTDLPTEPSTAAAPPLSELPMSVREAERTSLATPPTAYPAPPAPPTGLLQRLAERLGLGRATEK